MKYIQGVSWSWLHGSWIYNYLCNQCLSPLKLWVRTSIFNNISVITWPSVLLVEETGVPEENHLPVTSHWQTLSGVKHHYPNLTLKILLLTAVTVCVDLLHLIFHDFPQNLVLYEFYFYDLSQYKLFHVYQH
jgi:hypothetical protein